MCFLKLSSRVHYHTPRQRLFIFNYGWKTCFEWSSQFWQCTGIANASRIPQCWTIKPILINEDWRGLSDGPLSKKIFGWTSSRQLCSRYYVRDQVVLLSIIMQMLIGRRYPVGSCGVMPQNAHPWLEWSYWWLSCRQGSTWVRCSACVQLRSTIHYIDGCEHKSKQYNRGAKLTRQKR